MYFVFICRDKKGALQTRMDTRPDHLAYLKELDAKGVIKAAGPMLGDDEKPCGSLIIIEAENQAAAEEIASRDPYAHAGLFEEVDIKPYTWVLHAPEA